VLEIDGRWIGNGVSFSPYRRGQKPGTEMPTEGQVREDLHLMAPYSNLIRLTRTTNPTLPDQHCSLLLLP
jgi:hypothetical protein